MKLVNPSVEIIEQEPGLEGIYRQIERAGRTCYKSEDKITETSAKGFVDRMVKMKHLSTCEFGTVYLKIPAGKYQFLDIDYFDDCDDIKDSFYSNPYTRIHSQEGYHYISTNYRVLIENFAEEFIPELLQYLCGPTEYHRKRYTIKCICDRAVANEMVRHRKFSFLQESTRYCNYSKDKFGNELTFIIPNWLDLISSDNEIHIDGDEDKYCYPEDVYTLNFLYALKYAERAYLDLLTQWYEKIPDKRYKSGYKNNPWKPEQARNVLPLALKTELYMCGFAEDWQHFFDLRCSAAAHPDMRLIASQIQDKFIEKGYLICK